MSSKKEENLEKKKESLEGTVEENLKATTEEIKNISEELESEETLEKEVEESIEGLLEAKLLKAEEDLKASEDKYLRLYAEFENFKKRKNQEIETNNKYKSQKIISEILPSIDNLERALASTEETEETIGLLKGVQMVYEGLQAALKSEGVELIESTGEKFDPNVHQAVMQDSDSEKESGIVLETFQKGYKLKDRVIRPAMVKVNS
ncbi:MULTISPECIES: nucleotide exchange factor GrpE [unclassified Gemella]|uniref:nucleotide exchange factor GrpE n=1 Tax=unclassified Gemella TaxID=2624949 RepID=UPI0015D04506|nr:MULTISPECIES: nucleotide exchange factor GrpE [unclassified Gemella]MBF0710407.1 nucleotide exchange factor GrpE [Gemella sp. GL1.1]NYS27751.1 nucleotide exchange factor GrpE [Gemella sp. GL1]